MDKNAEQRIINAFPGLKDDPAFEITSPIDPNYNCIAWAYRLYKDRWMQPPKGTKRLDIDGVTWWPDGVREGLSIQCLVEAFQQIGYNDCDNWEHEERFIKVALYFDPKSNNWTHAAREGRQGQYWLSKLGTAYDIHHGNPFVIEGHAYGKVYCIMKREDI